MLDPNKGILVDTRHIHSFNHLPYLAIRNTIRSAQDEEPFLASQTGVVLDTSIVWLVHADVDKGVFVIGVENALKGCNEIDCYRKIIRVLLIVV